MGFILLNKMPKKIHKKLDLKSQKYLLRLAVYFWQFSVSIVVKMSIDDTLDGHQYGASTRIVRLSNLRILLFPLPPIVDRKLRAVVAKMLHSKHSRHRCPTQLFDQMKSGMRNANLALLTHKTKFITEIGTIKSFTYRIDIIFGCLMPIARFGLASGRIHL